MYRSELAADMTKSRIAPLMIWLRVLIPTNVVADVCIVSCDNKVILAQRTDNEGTGGGSRPRFRSHEKRLPHRVNYNSEEINPGSKYTPDLYWER
jgi:hypothetical protein